MSRVAQANALGEFRSAATALAGSDAVRDEALRDFEVDAQLPEIAVTPRTPEELASVLAEAQAARLAVIPMGGGAHLGAGNLAEAYDVAASITGLDRIVAHEPADLTVTIEAGVPFVELQRVLARHGQALPLDPPCDDSATIGGVLAANAYGPMRHAFGTARDWLIGLRVAQADGSIVKSGGRVVKNVTGYDMGKLHIGALGTLGVIVEATFKVAPLPKEQLTLAFTAATAADAASVATAAWDAGLAIHAIEVLSPTASHAVLARERWGLIASVAGGKAAVERSTRDLRSMAASADLREHRHDGDAVWAAWYQAFSPGLLTIRVVVPPADAGVAMEVLDRVLAGAGAQLSCTATAGVIRVQLRPGHDARAATTIERARAVAERYGGTVAIDAAPVSYKREYDVFGPLRSDFAIMRRLKEEFDPERTLSPGRFMGRL